MSCSGCFAALTPRNDSATEGGICDDCLDALASGGNVPRTMADAELYAACRINRNARATRRDMVVRHEALRRIVAEVRPCSVRQVYYQATLRGVVDKTDAGYDKVQRALVELRRGGVIPWRCVAPQPVGTLYKMRDGTCRRRKAMARRSTA